jgi:2-polyprenyl-6-methoxyphenol hydroxylase-like FAD-dependent oxidoreductase
MEPSAASRDRSETLARAPVGPRAKRLSVLIAGAGPTGLTLANCLSAYGLDFEIVDSKSGPSRDSKALAVNLLSRYCLALIHRGSSLGAEGCHVRRLNVFWKNQRLNPIDFRGLDFPFGTFVTQPQALTERELIAALPEPAGVAWRTELVAVEDRGAFVRARLRDPSGRLVERDYDFVIGCEGKNSVVREAIGGKLEGWDYPMHFLLGDFPLAWGKPTDQAYYYVFEDTFFVIVPVSASHWRVVVKRDGPFDASVLVQPADIIEPAERYLGKDLFAGPPSWISGAPFYMRTANTLGRERMFICGDAAHLFSPIGGTGMNTGMQDAFDLAWRLAYVAHGYAAPESLLPSYTEERREAIGRVAAATDGATRLIARLDTAPECIAPMLPRLSNRRLIRRELPLRQSGLTQAYDSSSVIRYSESVPGFKPGALYTGMLDLRREIESQLGRAPSALSTLVIAFVSGASLDRRGGELSELVRELGRRQHAPVSGYVVVFDADGPELRAPLRIVLRDAAVARRVGARDGALVAVRPDAIIAFSGELAARGDLFTFLDPWCRVPHAAEGPTVASEP